MTTDDPQPGSDPHGSGQQLRSDDVPAKALAAMMVGIGALLSFCLLAFRGFVLPKESDVVLVPVGIALAVAGVVLGVMGYRKAQTHRLSGRGFAVVGIVTSIVALVFQPFLGM